MKFNIGPFNIIIARRPGPILDPMPWGSLMRIHGTVTSALYDAETGRVKDVHSTHNLVTDDGDLFYSYFADYIRAPATTVVPDDLFTDNATPSVFDGIMEVWTGVTAAPVKASDRTTLTGASGTAVDVTTGVTEKTIESGHPKRNDTDTNNDGRAVDAVTYKYAYGTGELNASNMDDVTIGNPIGSPTNTKILMWADGLGRSKTSSDTLDIWVNHLMAGASS